MLKHHSLDLSKHQRNKALDRIIAASTLIILFTAILSVVR